MLDLLRFKINSSWLNTRTGRIPGSVWRTLTRTFREAAALASFWERCGAASALLEQRDTLPQFSLLGNMIFNGARATAAVKLGGVDRDAIEARLGAAGRPICAAHRRPPGTAGQRARYSSVENKTLDADGSEHRSADSGSARHVSICFRLAESLV